MTAQAIGFIGVGPMGGAVAEILVRSYEVDAYDKNPQRVLHLVAKGARGCESAVGAAVGKAFVITCLPRSQDVEQLLFGADGIGPVLNAGAVIRAGDVRGGRDGCRERAFAGDGRRHPAARKRAEPLRRGSRCPAT